MVSLLTFRFSENDSENARNLQGTGLFPFHSDSSRITGFQPQRDNPRHVEHGKYEAETIGIPTIFALTGSDTLV